MTGIRYISSSSVQASNRRPASHHRTELTPWDLQLLFVGPIQKGLLFSKPKQEQTQNTFNFTHNLKTSLSQTLDIFYPLAGRLATTDHRDNNTTSFFIDCNNAGALFVLAAADGVAVSDIIDPTYVPPIVHSFFPLNGIKNYEGTSKPLLAVQVTELADGIFLGCTMNHTVGDGSSFWHFFNTWSHISRSRGSLEYLSKPPVLCRWFLEGTEYPIRIPHSFIKQTIKDIEFIPPPLQERVFHFSKQNIEKLKAKANAEIGNSNSKISSLQAVLPHLWLSVVRNRKSLDPNEETHYRLLVGARSRLQSLPEQYFGNAVQAASVTMKAKELVEQGLGNAAWKLNRIVAEHTREDTLKKFLECWTRSPKLITMSNVTTNALVTSSSPRFNVYGNDFGWGKPIAVRSGLGNKSDGKITVFCGAEEGSIDIEACLSPETLQGMAKDQEFMDAVTI